MVRCQSTSAVYFNPDRRVLVKKNYMDVLFINMAETTHSLTHNVKIHQMAYAATVNSIRLMKIITSLKTGQTSPVHNHDFVRYQITCHLDLKQMIASIYRRTRD